MTVADCCVGQALDQIDMKLSLRVVGWRAAALLCILLALTVGASAQPAESAYDQVPGVRQPGLRRIVHRWDSNTLAQVSVCRRKLPLPQRGRFNFAWAEAHIKGLDKTEYYAHSSIHSLDVFSSVEADKLTGISLRPEEGRYATLCVNQDDIVDGPNCWQRDVDTEYKILEDIAARLPDRTVKGHLKLYTDLPPCASCWNVFKQFMADYTNVSVQVIYRMK